jgi:hypothetical protein
MTFRFSRILGLMTLAGFGLVASCGGDDDEDPGNVGECQLGEANACAAGLECQPVEGGNPHCFCSPEKQTGCGEGLVCELLADGNSGCFAPITLMGRVFDLDTDAGVAGARVVARDVNEVAVSGTAISGEDGTYELAVPTPRDADGTPRDQQVTLRADAAGYLTFPKAPRVAIPINTRNASGDPLVLQTAATDIGLVELESTAGLGVVSGKVIADRPWGTLVVAGGVSGLADRDGDYVVFNVPSGSANVRGYKVGLQLTEATADVVGGQETTGVDLEQTGQATSVVSGTINYVDAGGLSNTTVILAVQETFDPDVARGEAPPGLRVPASGTFRIEGVPDGNYVVLAAFENDELVRDPDTCIAGTEVVHIRVPQDQTDPISQSFKVTGALGVTGPDGEEVVSGTPTFVFADDASEDGYHVALYDAFGTLIWEDPNVPSVMGSSTVSVTYPGTPALESGMVYQFRATSYRINRSNNARCEISTTEDLRGVFVYE